MFCTLVIYVHCICVLPLYGVIQNNNNNYILVDLTFFNHQLMSLALHLRHFYNASVILHNNPFNGLLSRTTRKSGNQTKFIYSIPFFRPCGCYSQCL